MTKNELKLVEHMIDIAHLSLIRLIPYDINNSKSIVKLFKHASDEFGNHGCNDLSDNVYRGWSLKERRKFVYEFHVWNGDPEEYDENFLHLPDFAVFGFLAYKLENDKKIERVKKIKSLYE